MLTAKRKRKQIRTFTIYESLYKIIRILQRTIYFQLIVTFALQQYATPKQI